MLRNPHGAAGAEWNGDWSDSSTNWNQRTKGKLKYVPRDHEDGVFWMDIFDFTQQFSYLYVCRILSESNGWKMTKFKQSWKGDYAEGLPSRAYPQAILSKNPQYSIVVNKPVDAFIMLKQFEPDPTTQSTFKGKQNIMFMVQQVNPNTDKRITKVDKEALVGRSGNPINLATVSAEVNLPKAGTYSILVANTNHGAAGEGTFELRVYANDMQAPVTSL